MKKEIQMVEDFHKKYDQPTLTRPSLGDKERIDFRYNLIEEEVGEYRDALNRQSLPDAAKEICDILYSVYGTILEHGLQDKIQEIFEEVHRSNMTKDQAEFKLVKGKSYSKANTEQFFS